MRGAGARGELRWLERRLGRVVGTGLEARDRVGNLIELNRH